jgi:prepilin-type processing-associated H-X9-DG protein
VELLVVIAIIGILAAIIIPVAGQVRATAKSAQCISNLRQIGIAFQMYATNNKGYFPHAGRKPAGTEWMWDEAISEYLVGKFGSTGGDDVGVQPIGKKQIFYCPGDTLPQIRGWGAGRSYGILSQIGTPDASLYRVGGDNNFLGIYYESIPEPTRTILITDHSNPDNRVGGWACWNVSLASQMKIDKGSAGTNMHRGSFNYLFCDGHVAHLVPSATIGSGTLAQPKGMWTITPGD